jgi:hypothetical protein
MFFNASGEKIKLKITSSGLVLCVGQYILSSELFKVLNMVL